jgi:hypothetical protein
VYKRQILANQILLNKESRHKYDLYIADNADTHLELRDKFNKSVKDTNHNIQDKGASLNLFNYKIEELNKKHGYNSNLDKVPIIERFTLIKQKRDMTEIKIDKEVFVDTQDFNNKFENNKIDGKYKSQIVEYYGAPSELSTYTVGEHYTSLTDIDKLYIEDSIQNSKYSSLDRAFSLHPTLKPTNNISVDERMKQYQTQTKQINNMKPTEFSSKKFNEM